MSSRGFRQISSSRLARLSLLVFLFLQIEPHVAAQISPGPLSKAHRQWNGPAGCVSCHEVGAGSAQFRCLECHKDIASRVTERRGYHASVLPATAMGRDCVRCHSEHNGENFQIVRWDPKTFDHSKTGFKLDGKHAGVECAKCHNSNRISTAEKATLSARDLNKTFLGLTRACTTCHEDKHQGRLGADCMRCHNTSDWKVSGKFDHSKTRFPLTGAHLDVSCQKCHTMPDGTAKYTGLAFQQCSSCHADPHRGIFKQSCQSCHSTVAWKTGTTDAKFDHSKTAFPLLGKHVDVKCAACHERGDFTKVISFRLCSDCHKDPHNGQFAKRADGGKCESCHTVDGFKQSKFTFADHSKTAYPLVGKHVSVECAKCHIPKGSATIYKIKFAECMDCHKDFHEGQFAHAPYFAKCESCHTVQGYQPSMFTLAKHQQLQFKLTGGHAAVTCGECHKSPSEGKSAPYHFANLTCTTCHQDPHRGQFAKRMSAAGARGCEVCHSTKAWPDVSAFDHATTEFVLTGAHRAVRCADCHKPPNLEMTLKNVNFNEAPKQCEDCHRDPHGDQFARAGTTRCAECHNTAKWRPSLFDHEKTMFPLQGAHKDVPCGQCHKQIQLVEGNKVLFYKPTPRACAACHGTTIPTKPAKT